MITIKVLGSGCANCKRLEQIAREAVAAGGFAAEVIKVTDHAEIASYDILATPGLVINEKVASSGRVPALNEVAAWLAQAAETA